MRRKLFDLARKDVIIARFIDEWFMGRIEWAELLQRLAHEQCEHYNHIASYSKQIDIQDMGIPTMNESTVIEFICVLSKAKQDLIEVSVYTDPPLVYFVDEIKGQTSEQRHD